LCFLFESLHSVTSRYHCWVTLATLCHLSGIKRLVSQGVYTSFFPLHSGSYKFEKLGVDRIENKRQELFYEWARPGAFMKEQPYDAIRLMLCCTIPYYIILYYIILHYTVLYYTILCYITLYCIILHYIVLYYTILYYITLYHIVLHCIILYYTMLYYITLYYAMSHYTILYCTISYCITLFSIIYTEKCYNV